MSCFFISDLHLSDKTPDILRGFQLFLDNQAADAQALYILGDFFDAWIGDDEDAPFANEVRRILKQYTQSGIPTYFICGNRDFLVGERFFDETGINPLADVTVIESYKNPILIMHGDTLCTGDVEYLKFRAMVRSPQWQQQVLSLPLEQRRAMAADLRSKSLSLNAMKAEDIMDVTPSEVTNALKENGSNLLIHGHTHRPNTHQLELEQQTTQRVVLGDWSATSGWYAKLSAQGVELIEFQF